MTSIKMNNCDQTPPAKKARTMPAIYKVSKTQWKTIYTQNLLPESQWFEDVNRHLDTKGLRPQPTSIMVAEDGMMRCEPNFLMNYSDEFIRGWLFEQTQPSGVVKVAERIAAREAFNPTITDHHRSQFPPLYGNLIFVYSDKKFAKAGLGDPKATADLGHIHFY